MKISRLLIFGTALLCVTAAVADPLKLVSTSPSFWAVNVNPLAQKTIP